MIVNINEKERERVKMKINTLEFSVENSNIVCNLHIEYEPYMRIGGVFKKLPDFLLENGIRSEQIEDRSKVYTNVISVRITTNALKLLEVLQHAELELDLENSPMYIYIHIDKCNRTIIKYLEQDSYIDIDDLDMPENYKKAIRNKINTVYNNLHEYFNIMQIMKYGHENQHRHTTHTSLIVIYTNIPYINTPFLAY